MCYNDANKKKRHVSNVHELKHEIQIRKDGHDDDEHSLHL